MIFRILLFFILISSLISVSSFVGNKKKSPPKKVINTLIIDPGHGGHDAGARGQFSNEKDICLAISLQLGEMIKAEFPDLKILYTRQTDIYPALHARAKFANENNGDLYLCVHVNSAPGRTKAELTGYKTVTYYTGKGASRKKRTKSVPQYRYVQLPSEAKGTETYIWGAHRSEDKELAIKENAPMLKEENFIQNYGNIDVNSPEFMAFSLLKTKQYFKRSATLAGFIQDEFVKVGRVDRDVRQRGIGIWVLQATAMPSVLVETGFISNPEEEKYLNSAEGQKELSTCIVNALKTYVAWLEQRQNNGGQELPAKDSNGPLAFLQQVETAEKKRNNEN